MPLGNARLRTLRTGLRGCALNLALASWRRSGAHWRPRRPVGGARLRAAVDGFLEKLDVGKHRHQLQHLVCTGHLCRSCCLNVSLAEQIPQRRTLARQRLQLQHQLIVVEPPFLRPRRAGVQGEYRGRRLAHRNDPGTPRRRRRQPTQRAGSRGQHPRGPRNTGSDKGRRRGIYLPALEARVHTRLLSLVQLREHLLRPGQVQRRRQLVPTAVTHLRMTSRHSP